MFFCVDSPWDDPARNLAAEEFLLRSRKEDFVMFYVNAPSVIVGKHQNVFREVNLAFAARRGIPVVRRLTGGGTVYHDRGNLNFSFILSGEQGKLVDFARYIRPVTEFLQSLGVPAVTDDRNNILIGGKKISGNAEHIFKERVLHHGTLLFDSVLADLEEALQPNPGEVQDKAIRSRTSRVTNIKRHLQKEMTLEEMREGLKAWCLDYFSPCRTFSFTEEEVMEIDRLAQEKYASWEWNTAYSPRCVLRRTLTSLPGRPALEIALNKGRVEEVVVKGGPQELHHMAEQLKGSPFRYEVVEKVLVSLHMEGKLSVLSVREGLQVLFGY